MIDRPCGPETMAIGTRRDDEMPDDSGTKSAGKCAAACSPDVRRARRCDIGALMPSRAIALTCAIATLGSLPLVGAWSYVCRLSGRVMNTPCCGEKQRRTRQERDECCASQGQVAVRSQRCCDLKSSSGQPPARLGEVEYRAVAAVVAVVAGHALIPPPERLGEPGWVEGPRAVGPPIFVLHRSLLI